MTLYSKESLISFIRSGIILVVFGILTSPAVVSAKIQTLAYLNVLDVVDFRTKETSLAYFGIETSTIEKPDFEKLDRINRLDAYFAKRDMPLAGYGAKFVEVAEKCNIDWRLLPAIGVRESSGGKHLMNNNPFGWGSAKIKFTDFNDAIENVSDHLCGLRESTARYYRNKTQAEKLWYYNGSVMPSYPREVVEIMDMM